MTRANLTLPDGTKVTIEGTAAEVAELLHRVVEPSAVTSTARLRSAIRPGARKGRTSSKGPIDHVRELVAVDYFSTKRGLGDIQRRLEEAAHIYPQTSLSPALFRMVRAKELRRIKEGGAWKYVNP